MSQTHPVPRQTDVRRRTAIPSAASLSLNPQNSSSNPYADLTSAQYLDKVEEDFNKKIDTDVEVLVEGMADLVKLQKIEGKDHFKAAQDAFQVEIRTEAMIRAAHSLLSLSHSLKLLHIFNDVSTPTKVREELADKYEREVRELKAELGMA